MVSTIDIFSTLADITTGTLPDPKKAAPDSFSFYPILKNSSRPSQRPFLIHRDAPGRQALRVGPWKLIHNIYPNNHGKPFKHRGQKELYHLNRDPMELNNLYASMPEKVNEMEKIYLEAKTAKQTRRTW
jgi:arylsulfatase A-like enzyme